MTHVCFTLQVDPARLDAYRQAHAAVWPGMLKALHETGWRNYRLFLRPDGLLVGTLETEDLAAAQAAMARTEVNARWQAAMAEFFPVLGELRPDEGMVVLDQIFHLEEQLARCDRAVEPGR
ncbi:L-rhamnose mutarotase [Actinoplanes oblitus]|uniref:L-rhamnose mutarotase n=1 Tax=Actinoplanes oblitus TaxID=3040509 RepID=A0ABY8WB27_9ACTN|nr:L-rhamnose mutarotase [Actinoplanes oblitus]WIM94137.1 L-rhamnose mutarotase [Actinoplanes oblitus]